MHTSTIHPILDRLSALGDETRTRILALLQRSELTVSELSSVLQIPQPSVSRHLKTLSSEGWLQVRAEGRSRHYTLAEQLDASASEVWAIVRGELEGMSVYAADAERAVEVLHHRRRRAADFFAEAAEKWDDLRAELFGPSAGYAPLLGLLDSNWTVADLGSGTGALSETLAPFVARVIGIDRSAEMLSAARLRLEGTENVELRQGELEDLPIQDAEIDLAVLGLVLHYVADPVQVLGEARRVLRPGGRLIVVEMRSHDRGLVYAQQMGHAWAGFAPEQVDGWLEEVGFTTRRICPLRPDPGAGGPLLFLASAT